MAGDGDGDWVGGAGAGYGSRRGGLTDGLCHLAIRFCRTEGDRLQVSPHAALEGGGANVERQRRVAGVAAHLVQQRDAPWLEVAFVWLCLGEGEFTLQAFEQFVVGFRKLDR